MRKLSTYLLLPTTTYVSLKKEKSPVQEFFNKGILANNEDGRCRVLAEIRYLALGLFLFRLFWINEPFYATGYTSPGNLASYAALHAATLLLVFGSSYPTSVSKMVSMTVEGIFSSRCRR
jgi:hypothetical protein